MKIGDIVEVESDGHLGLILEKYKNEIFDWEVVSIKGNFSTGCKQDCFRKCDLILYDWKDYPKTFIQKLKLLINW